MDDVDKQILNVIQAGFPVTERPYADLAARVGLVEEEMVERIGRLKADGVIRRIGATFDSGKLGYASTLCAMKAPAERVDEVAGIVNSFENVTHNYLRDDERLNMWFTVIAESETRIDEVIDEIRGRTGIGKILNLPAVRLFKVKVEFAL